MAIKLNAPRSCEELYNMIKEEHFSAGTPEIQHIGLNFYIIFTPILDEFYAVCIPFGFDSERRVRSIVVETMDTDDIRELASEMGIATDYGSGIAGLYRYNMARSNSRARVQARQLVSSTIIELKDMVKRLEI